MDQNNIIAPEVKELKIKVESLTKALLAAYEELTFLHGLASVVTAEMELREVALAVLQKTVVLIGASKGGLIVLHDEMKAMILEKAKDVAPEALIVGDTERDLAYRIFNQVLKSKKIQIYNELPHNFMPRICVPLELRNEVQGLLYLIGKKNGTAYTSMDKGLLLAVAAQIAIIIENVKLRSGAEKWADTLSALWAEAESGK